MTIWTCPNCDSDFDGGFFNNRQCPECVNWFTRFVVRLVQFLKIGIPAGVVLLLIFFFNGGGFSRIISTAGNVIDIRTFYIYGHEAYSSSIVKGESRATYTLTAERPFFTKITGSDMIKTTVPVMSVPRGTVVILGGVIRRGGDVWAPAEFYSGETPVRGFILMPRHWEDSVTVFNMENAIDAFEKTYREYVIKNFALKKVTDAQRRKFEEENPEYFRLKDIEEKKAGYYAKKSDKNGIDKVYSYYLDKSNINMMILQSDRGYKRPPLNLK